MIRLSQGLASALLFGSVLGCSPAPSPAAPSGVASATSASPPSNIDEVLSDVIVVDCPDSPKLSGRAAEASIHRLVEGCTSIPGGNAHFAATLRPGGRIELAAPKGSAGEGVVPTCVLKHELTHRLPLTRDCSLDVTMSEKKPHG